MTHAKCGAGAAALVAALMILQQGCAASVHEPDPGTEKNAAAPTWSKRRVVRRLFSARRALPRSGHARRSGSLVSCWRAPYLRLRSPMPRKRAGAGRSTASTPSWSTRTSRGFLFRLSSTATYHRSALAHSGFLHRYLPAAASTPHPPSCATPCIPDARSVTEGSPAKPAYPVAYLPLNTMKWARDTATYFACSFARFPGATTRLGST